MFDLSEKPDLIWQYFGFNPKDKNKCREVWHLILDDRQSVGTLVRFSQWYLDYNKRDCTPDESMLFAVRSGHKELFQIVEKHREAVKKLFEKSAAGIIAVDFYETCPTGEQGNE